MLVLASRWGLEAEKVGSDSRRNMERGKLELDILFALHNLDSGVTRLKIQYLNISAVRGAMTQEKICQWHMIDTVLG